MKTAIHLLSNVGFGFGLLATCFTCLKNNSAVIKADFLTCLSLAYFKSGTVASVIACQWSSDSILGGEHLFCVKGSVKCEAPYFIYSSTKTRFFLVHYHVMMHKPLTYTTKWLVFLQPILSQCHKCG